MTPKINELLEAISFGRDERIQPARVHAHWLCPNRVHACALLAAEGIDVEVIDPRTIAPLDTETILRSVAKTGRALIVDEDFAHCGVSA
ncbi:MAG: alpha-ketoacid dehydrogenase subunit beta, partial [Sphingomonadaceae bacterium]|nr:alpha-ketoacid dehydrogenase subunit beta [Sphingomonadaceae bacterium]